MVNHWYRQQPSLWWVFSLINVPHFRGDSIAHLFNINVAGVKTSHQWFTTLNDCHFWGRIEQIINLQHSNFKYSNFKHSNLHMFVNSVLMIQYIAHRHLKFTSTVTQREMSHLSPLWSAVVSILWTHETPWRCCGNGRQLIYKKFWVQILAQNTWWIFFTFICCKICTVWKDRNYLKGVYFKMLGRSRVLQRKNKTTKITAFKSWLFLYVCAFH